MCGNSGMDNNPLPPSRISSPNSGHSSARASGEARARPSTVIRHNRAMRDAVTNGSSLMNRCSMTSRHRVAATANGALIAGPSCRLIALVPDDPPKLPALSLSRCRRRSCNADMSCQRQRPSSSSPSGTLELGPCQAAGLGSASSASHTKRRRKARDSSAHRLLGTST